MRRAPIILAGEATEEWWWCSASFATFAVCVATGSNGDQAIVEAAPIARRFLGQHPKALGAWLRRSGPVRFERLPTLDIR